MNNVLDIDSLKDEFYEIYLKKDDNQLKNWSIIFIKHILDKTKFNYEDNVVIDDILCEMREFKESCSLLKKLIRKSKNEFDKQILTAVYYALMSQKKRKFIIVSSDYAIKLVNIIYPSNKQELINERIWQINSLRSM